MRRLLALGSAYRGDCDAVYRATDGTWSYRRVRGVVTLDGHGFESAGEAREALSFRARAGDLLTVANASFPMPARARILPR